MIKESIIKLSNGQHLSYEEAQIVMTEIMTGKTTPAQTAAFLTSMHMNGENVDEVSGCAYVMRGCAERVNYNGNVMEIVGTGGDGAQSINISTISGLVCAAAGAKVAKHGNRAASSRCGAADCLEALGVKISLSPQSCVKLLDKVGMCFMFAQRYHNAMKYVGPVRKEIGIPTVFNILGPLTNPAHANFQLLGVYKKELLMPMAKTLVKLGVERGMAVFGQDKIDEISVGAATCVVEFEDGKFTEYEIHPEQFGLKRYNIGELRGGEPSLNAERARNILKGEQGAGRNSVLLNAGAALHIYKGITIDEGIKLAAEMIDSRAAYNTLQLFVETSQSLD